MRHDLLTSVESPAAVRSRGDERGQATVEFAMMLPIICILLFAIIQFGMAFWTYQQVSAAASEGARRGAVSRASTSRTTDIQQAARAASPNLVSSSMNVASSSTWLPGAPLTVTVTYPVQVRIMAITFFDDRLSVSRTARVEQ